ncbi:hypothetical protein [Arthrobacter sp. NyZ413]|uniref:hypothetical protein n=1 Tax=Arthrobacter sp. NyZ413 TaxID=3144669 RepID=UPI003BF86C62
MTDADAFRAWAKGSYTIEAATELLLRAFGGRFAAPGNPWVHVDSTDGDHPKTAWIDFEAIPEHTGPLSGGERRLLAIAASIAEDVPIVLGDVIPGLDRDVLDLVLAALAHAGGSHEHTDGHFSGNGTFVLGRGYADSLHPWPRESPGSHG